jgi:pimeloyl-ACP methyl ester carboxylesterase
LKNNEKRKPDKEQEPSQKNKRHKLRFVLKVAGLTLAGVVLLPIIALFVIRGVNYFNHRLPGGVREKVFIQLGGMEQYINIRGESEENPVVIWLHGGPGSPDSFITMTFQRELDADYTFIRWDQRGCGRTYYKSRDAPLSRELILADLDDLVDYAIERFNQPVILVGHSWGTILGSTYAAAHPEKIMGYVGIGQCTDNSASERLAAETASDMARAAGNEQDAAEIEKLYLAYTAAGLASDNFDMDGFTRFRRLTTSYLSPDDKDPTLTALFSPDFGWDDLRWNLRLMTDMEWFDSLNKPLYAAFDDFTPPYLFNVPVVFIQGGNDYVCATELAAEYQRSLTAPLSEMFVMPGLGHSPMFDDPDAFAKILKKALNLVSGEYQVFNVDINTSMTTYPENFLTMRRTNDSKDNNGETPFIYASGQNANGEFRIAYYNDYDSYEIIDTSGEAYAVQTVYKNANYVTSEGVFVGSAKDDVLTAYQKYGLKEYKINRITSMGLNSLDIVILGIDLTDRFLYIDNHNIFNDSYPGHDYWGGLGAIIFILDQDNTVAKIVSYAPTSG